MDYRDRGKSIVGSFERILNLTEMQDSLAEVGPNHYSNWNRHQIETGK